MATVLNKGDPFSVIEPHIPSPAQARALLKDGVTIPATIAGYGQIFIDAADGDLKIKYGDGTVKLIVADT